MLRGIATVSFWVDDLVVAKQWYAELLGIEAYFTRPGKDGMLAYAEFRIGDYQHELGLIDRRYAPAGAVHDPNGAIVYWHVDDVPTVLDRLLSMGATQYQPPVAWGDQGFITASVVDPFGNILGIMYNPHYLKVLEATKKA